MSGIDGLISRWLVGLRALLSGCSAVLLMGMGAHAQPNPITSYTRVWAELDVVPNMQWAPNSVDSDANKGRTLQIFKFQPVFPFQLNDDWTLLTRTIFRFISLPTAVPLQGFSPSGLPQLVDWQERNITGLSDISPTAFLVPNLGSDFTIGLGASFVLPVADGPLDSGKLSAGPALLGFFHRGPLLLGARMRNVWSLADGSDRVDVNRLVVRGLLRYQLNPDWYLISSPIITADWTRPAGSGWTVPFGGGIGRSFQVAGRPMQVSVEGYYNAVKPRVLGQELLGDWTIRTQWQVLLPN